jgi:hypothetical protein
LKMRVDAQRRWWIEDDELPDLHGCIDVDLGITPTTNTLPIRRLNLQVGAAAEVTAAWIGFPKLSVQALAQRYTRLEASRYRYESLASDFSVVIEVDELGMVTRYPGFWERVAALQGGVFDGRS